MIKAIVFGAFFLGYMGALGAIETITVALAPRPSLATNTGEGLYVEMLRQLFPPNEYTLVFEYAPLNTVIHRVATEKVDLAIDYVYLPDRKEVLYADKKLVTEVVELLYAKEKVIPWNGVETLKDQKVSIFFSYPFEKQLEFPIEHQEYRILNVAMKQVQTQELPCLMDFRWDIDKTAEEYFFDLGKFTRRKVFEVDTVMAFQNNAKGEQLKKIVEGRIEALEDSGELKTLFKRYGKAL